MARRTRDGEVREEGVKTNAVRMLESAGGHFQLHSYGAPDGRIDARSVAEKLEIPAERLFKTLVARTSAGEVVIYCIPGSTELDLKKAAGVAGAKRVAMVRPSELVSLTGYERGGCSPIGMKHSYPLWLEESAQAFDRILISAGAIGLQIELAPDLLCSLTGARLADLV